MDTIISKKDKQSDNENNLFVYFKKLVNVKVIKKTNNKLRKKMGEDGRLLVSKLNFKNSIKLVKEKK